MFEQPDLQSLTGLRDNLFSEVTDELKRREKKLLLSNIPIFQYPHSNQRFGIISSSIIIVEFLLYAFGAFQLLVCIKLNYCRKYISSKISRWVECDVFFNWKWDSVADAFESRIFYFFKFFFLVRLCIDGCIFKSPHIDKVVDITHILRFKTKNYFFWWIELIYLYLFRNEIFCDAVCWA